MTENKHTAPDPTRLLKDGESISDLQRRCEGGESLSSRQWQILYENSVVKMQQLAQEV